MRIHSVCADPGIRPDGTKGAAIHLRSIAAALAARGHDVTLFTRRAPENAATLAVPWRPLHEFAGADAPDLVYERLSLGHRAGLDAARAWSCPFALEVNAPLVDEARRYRPSTVGPGDEATETQLLRGADVVVGVSRTLCAWIGERRGTDDGVATVRNGFDPRRFSTPADVEGQPPTLVFLGDPKPWHGASRLPAIIAGLHDRGAPIQLLVIGGGDGAETVREQARAHGVGRWVRVTGSVSASRASELLRGATIGIAPYDFAPSFYFCPLKVIEYLAAGLPVVTSRQGDLEDIVGPGGVFVDRASTDAWIDALLPLARSPERRADLQWRGRAHAFASLTWDAAASRLLQHVVPVVKPVLQ